MHQASAPAGSSLRLLFRFAAIVGVICLLAIPLALIRDTIRERATYRADAVARVVRSTAGEQTFVGPFIVLPWTDQRQESILDGRGLTTIQLVRTSGISLLLPQRSEVLGVMVPAVRRIGLYEVTGYQWRATIKASFARAELPAPAEGSTRVWGAPTVLMRIDDVRGLIGAPGLRADGRAIPVGAGGGKVAPNLDGVHATLAAPSDATFAGVQLELDLTLRGTRSLTVAPVGDDNVVAIESSWPHPLFEGYSPQSTISDAGFSARWQLSALASDVQATLRAAAQREGGVFELPSLGEESSLRVSLVNPVDVYTQSDRASKYAMLFILLTFAGFVLFELARRLAIHPVQYALVGVSLALFFLMLVSLSEHLAFPLAYAIASAAQIGVLFIYLSGMLRSWTRAAGFAAMLSSLYGVLYCLLASEDNAFLMGSLLIFSLVSAAMWATRKIDWYELTAHLTKRTQPPEPVAPPYAVIMTPPQPAAPVPQPAGEPRRD